MSVSEHDTEIEEFDFYATDYPKVWVVSGAVILFASLVFGIVAFGVQNLLSISPTVANVTTTGLNVSFTTGYIERCFSRASSGYCETLPMAADGDETFNRITNLRLSALGLHASAMILEILVFCGVVVILVFWSRRHTDSKSLRIGRTILGALLMVCGLCLQVAILLFHIEQFDDKWGRSTRLPYGFNNWDEGQRTTTNISFGVSYILLWVSTLLTFASTWIVLGSTCCWTREYVDVEVSDISFELPRLDPLKQEPDLAALE